MKEHVYEQLPYKNKVAKTRFPDLVPGFPVQPRITRLSNLSGVIIARRRNMRKSALHRTMREAFYREKTL